MSASVRPHHVILATTDLPRISDFYGDVLKLPPVGPVMTAESRSVSFLGPDDDNLDQPYLSFVIGARLSGMSPETQPLGGLTLGVRRGTLDQWRSTLVAAGSRPVGRAWAFGQEYLCFSDPDGTNLAIVESDLKTPRLFAVEVHVRRNPDLVGLVAEHLGFTSVAVDGLTTRLQSASRSLFLDLLDDRRPDPAPVPQGSTHRIVFRARDLETLSGISEAAGKLGLPLSRPAGAPHAINIDLRQLCDFDFCACVNNLPPGGTTLAAVFS